jgi:hypothetical protein
VGGGGSRLARGQRRSRTDLEGPAGGGESPVGDAWVTGVRREREYRRTRDIWREAGVTTPQG